MNAWHRAGRSIGRRVAALATLILLIGGIPSAQASPGDLDTGFSSDGKVLTDIGTADSGRAVAADDDHRRPALPGRRNPPPALLPGMNRADSWRSGLIRSERG